MLKKIDQTAAWLSERLPAMPQAAIVLGSGLSDFAEQVEPLATFAYRDIPNFPVSTVEGHKGELLIGRLAGRVIALFKGRFHYYEGYSMQQVTFHVRVLQRLGVPLFVLTNAAGAVNPSFVTGDIMLIEDHINFMPENPLHGPNLPFGERFPNMQQTYDPDLRERCIELARSINLELKRGVYLATQGPTYETPAEYRMYRLWGADAVGMSTVPEAIVAHHGGMRVLGLSVITNTVSPTAATNHAEVQQAAAAKVKKLAELLKILLAEL